MSLHRNRVEGRVYRFRSRKECEERNITLPKDVTKLIRAHMVLVLNWSSEREGYVEVMTVRHHILYLRRSTF
jgi:hypothetical protein